MKDLSKLIGLSYEEANCWELARRFYSEILGLELKHYVSDIPEDRKGKKDLIYTNRGDFLQVVDPKFGDLILFNIRGIESHLGVYIDDQRFLHSSRGTGSALDRIERWKQHISGYYRHTPKAESSHD